VLEFRALSPGKKAMHLLNFILRNAKALFEILLKTCDTLSKAIPYEETP
jgi:hypothetical protein